MARVNTRKPPVRTHEGGPAKRIGPEAELRRSILATMLFEDQFYEDGIDIAIRIMQNVARVEPRKVADLAAEARNRHNLRHAPLLLASALAYVHRGDSIVADLVPEVVRRPDELAELVAIHARVNAVEPSRVKHVLGAGLKRGLAKAFGQFDAYQLAKYDRPGEIKLRDVMFLAHPKPRDAAQERDFKALAEGTLAAPDTWEVARMRGEGAKDTFERLLKADKLGYLALLRNLRKMGEAGVDRDLVRHAIRARKGAGRVLPFRYVAAARMAPSFANDLDFALQAALADEAPLAGSTVVVVDVSGSMVAPVSSRSQINRCDAAATLAVMVPGEDVRVLVFSARVAEVARWPGLAGIDAIINGVSHAWTDLGAAVRRANDLHPDRIIVVTDEQSHTRVPDPVAPLAYMINVASYRNGVGYGRWTHIDGFSESTLRYIRALEAEAA